VDVVDMLLDRRRFLADRIHDRIEAINLYSDGSPNTGLEFQGMIMEVFYKDGTARRIILPGSTLAYGLADAVSKGLALLWSLWLVCGPSIENVQYVLNLVVSIATDTGAEIHLLSIPDIVRAFYCWISGKSLDEARAFVKHDQRLFPFALRISGWGHAWGNIMKGVAKDTPRWLVLEKHMRAQTIFWKNKTWRQHVATCLKRAGVDDIDDSILNKHAGSLTKLRYETYAVVTERLSALRTVCETHIQREWFQNASDKAALHDFMESCQDAFFWKFITVSSREVWYQAERSRRWGMVCTCEVHVEMRARGVKHIDCWENGRRLHEAWDHVSNFCIARRQRAHSLSLDDCEGDGELLIIIRGMLQRLASLANYRHKYIDSPPWSFAKASTPEGASSFLERVRSQSLEDHDPLTRYLMSTNEHNLQVLSDGGVLHGNLWAAVKRMRRTNLNEGLGEGYHRSTTHEQARASGASSQHLKQEVRVKTTLEKIKKFRHTYGHRADDVLRHDWRTWKRILQPTESWRPVRMSTKAFFARLYREDALALDNWNQVVTKQGVVRPVQREELSNSELMRDEYIASLLAIGAHYSVPRTEEQGMSDNGELVMQIVPCHFEVLQINRSRSRIHTLHTVDAADDVSRYASLAVEVQFEEVHGSSQVADEVAEETTVAVSAEPTWISPRQLVDWDTWLHKSLVYKDVKPSSTPCCLALREATLARPLCDNVLDDACPTYAIMLHNMKNGWNGIHSKIVHTESVPALFDGTEAIRYKAYHQCIAMIDKCLPLTSNIPSRQCKLFYKCLMSGVAVEPDLKAKEYGVLLDRHRANEGLPLLAIEDNFGHPPLAIEDIDGDGILVPMPQRDVSPPRPKRESVPGRATSSRSPAICDAQTNVPSVSVPGSSTDDAVASGEGNVDADAIVLGPQPAILDKGSSFGTTRSRGERIAWFPGLDGAEVNFKDYVQSNGVSYRNFKLKCKKHGDKCIKTKGEIESLTKLHGNIGALAFLHAWSSLEDDPLGKRHVLCNPSAAMVADFASRRKRELEMLYTSLTSSQS
jgi:hypothetical protein